MGRGDRSLVLRSHGTLSRTAGFTLLEAVVTLALVATLTAGLALVQREVAASMRLYWAGQQVSLELQRARLRSVAENTDYRVVFTVGADRFQVQRSTGGTFVASGADLVLPAGVWTASCTAPGQTVRFRPRGNAATFGTIALRNDQGDERRVVVNIAGRVRVEG